MATKENVASYYRVSSKRQEEKETIEQQREYIPQYIERKGWNLTAEYEDVAIPGSTVVGRDGLNKMLAEVEQGKFKRVVVRDAKRLGRTLDIDGIQAIYGTLQKSNTFLHQTTTGRDVDISTFEGFILAMIDVALAAKDNMDRSEAIRAGQQRARKQGRFATGRLPYTVRWNKEKGEFVLDEAEARTLKAMVNLIRQGHSSLQVADILNGSEDFLPPRHAPKWTDGLVVRRIKTDFHYTGILVSRKHNIETDTGIRLFTKQEMLEVRQIMSANRRVRSKQGGQTKRGYKSKEWLPKDEFLLYRLAKCTCGWYLMAVGYKVESNVYRYYRCRKCWSNFQADELDRVVWYQFTKAYQDKGNLTEQIYDQEYVPMAGETAATWNARREAAKQQLAAIERSRSEIQVEYFAKKRMTAETYNAILRELDEQEVKAQETKEQSENALMQPVILQEAISRAVTAVASYVEWVQMLEETTSMYEWAEENDPEIAKKFKPLLQKGLEWMGELEEYVFPKLESMEQVEHFLREQKRRILTEIVARGGSIVISPTRQIEMRLAASESFILVDDKLIPA